MSCGLVGQESTFPSSMSGTGANSVPLGRLHPILMAKQQQEVKEPDNSLAKLEAAKRAASALQESERVTNSATVHGLR